VKLSGYFLKETPAGSKTLLYSGNREIKIHSAYDPVKESERAVSSFKRGRSSLIMVSGLGLAYHIEALQKRFPDAQIIVIEKEKEVISLAGEVNPGILNTIEVIQSEADLPMIFEEINMSGFRGISHYIHRPSYLISREFYDSIAQNIKQYISSKVSDLLTRFEFEERWVDNIFTNLHETCSSGLAADLFGRFKGYPGIIVSAGPSLRKNAHILNSLKERALILSVDTAAKALEKNGVIPHFIMTLDAQKHSVKHFLGLKNQSPALLADIVSYPAILRKYSGRKFISTTSKYYISSQNENIRETTPVMDWLEKSIQPVGDIQSGGSVATSALDLMMNLGCDPIILVGQDLAYTGREIHCSGTHHNDDWLQKINRVLNLDTINQRVIRKRKIKYVESFGGEGKTISDFVLDLYKSWFEDSAQKISQEIINATEGGARIKNTIEKKLLQITEETPEKEKTPDKIIAECQNPGTRNPQKLIKRLESALEQLSELKKSAEKGLEGSTTPDIPDLINKYDLMQLLNPYLRKSETYVLRHDISGKEAEDIFYKGLIQAHNKLVPLISRSLKNLSKL
jgi:hypothetical protein